jgi:ADP-heptose:LPS heptosyltransferase
VGDGLLTFPALQQLRRRQPSLRCTLAAHGALGEIARRYGLCDTFLPFDGPVVGSFFVDDGGRAASRLWEPVTHVVVLMRQPPDALLASLRRVGAKRVSTAPGVPDDDRHVALYLADLVGSTVGARLASDAEILYASLPPSRGHAASGRPGDTTRRIALHPGSGGEAKNWALSRFADLAGLLSQDLSARVSVIIGPAEREREALIRAAFAPVRPTFLVGLPLDALAEQLLQHALYVGNDSGVSHLAGLLGVPSLVAFGPTEPARWRPVGPFVTTIRRQPRGDLSVEEMRQAARAALSGASG